MSCQLNQNDGKGFVWNDSNDKEFDCGVGILSAKAADGATEDVKMYMKNRVDYCKMRVKVKKDNKVLEFNEGEFREGRTNDAEGKSLDDLARFNDNHGAKDCVYDKVGSVVGLSNDSMSYMPTVSWMRPFAEQDENDDITLKYSADVSNNYTVYWFIRAKDNEQKGESKMFFLDDPNNSVFSGAKTLIAGVASAAGLVYATLF